MIYALIFNRELSMVDSAEVLRQGVSDPYWKIIWTKRSDENWDIYEKQRDFGVEFPHQSEEKYFVNIKVKNIFEN